MVVGGDGGRWGVAVKDLHGRGERHGRRVGKGRLLVVLLLLLVVVVGIVVVVVGVRLLLLLELLLEWWREVSRE